MTTARELITAKIEHLPKSTRVLAWEALRGELGDLELTGLAVQFLDWFMNWDAETIFKLVALISNVQRAENARRAVAQRAPSMDANVLTDMLDHAGNKFRIVIQGHGNPNKPVYLCGCGVGIRAGEPLNVCPRAPSPILTCIGVEP